MIKKGKRLIIIIQICLLFIVNTIDFIESAAAEEPPATMTILSTIPEVIYDDYRIDVSTWGGKYSRPVSSDGMIIIGSFDSDSDNCYNCIAYRWSEVSGLTLLGDLPGGRVESRASGISGDGAKIVGESWSLARASDPFQWDELNGIRLLDIKKSAARTGQGLFKRYMRLIPSRARNVPEK